MSITKEQIAGLLRTDKFPLSNKYDPEWVLDNAMGPSALWLTEWLCEKMDLRPGMRVLDMGCGKAMSSIFLARELGVTVWATDLWISATENWQTIQEAGLGDRVFPIHAEARSLPYAEGFFDAIVSIDSYNFYGTDNLYLKYFVRFVKPGGQIGIVDAGLTREFDGEAPEHLTRQQANGNVFWDPSACFIFHTAEWWRRHWEQTRLVDVEIADTMPDGCQLWLQCERALSAAGKNSFPLHAEALEEDAGRYLGLVRMVARRKGDG